MFVYITTLPVIVFWVNMRWVLIVKGVKISSLPQSSTMNSTAFERLLLMLRSLYSPSHMITIKTTVVVFVIYTTIVVIRCQYLCYKNNPSYYAYLKAAKAHCVSIAHLSL